MKESQPIDKEDAGWSNWLSCQTHDLEIAGSNPVPAMNRYVVEKRENHHHGCCSCELFDSVDLGSGD